MDKGGRHSFRLGHVLTISIAHLVHDIYSSFLAPLLPLLIDRLSLSYAQAGFLSVAQRLPSLLNPLVGVIADRVNVRYFIIVSPSITAVVMSLLGAVPHYGFLIILLLVMGVSASLFHVPGPVMIKHLSGDRVGKGMSFYMLGGELARTLGPLVILAAVSYWSMEGTWRLIPFGLAASLVLFIKVRKLRVPGAKQAGDTESGGSWSIRHLVPFFVILSGFIFFRACLKAALTIYLPTFLTARGGSLWMGGIALSIIQFSGAAGTFFGGSISDKIGRRTTLLIAAVASPALMGLFLLAPGAWTVPLLIVMGIFLFAQGPVLLALAQDHAGSRPALVNGIYMTLSFLIASLGVMIVGTLGDWLGLETTFQISALLAFGAIPIVLKLQKPAR
jgi:FSR family fosmidomycin resistance protein-like MFS transporter